MTQPANESRLPSLFAHTSRKDWGVGVLAWEADGKRGYLFENGEERTMANGYFELIHFIDQPADLKNRIKGKAKRRRREGEVESNRGGKFFFKQRAQVC